MNLDRLLLFLFANLLFTTRTTAQDRRDYPRLMREGAERQARKQDREALNKHNAAKLCDPAKPPDVDERINALFEAVEREKTEAIARKEEAERANRKAILATETKVLHWASESDKLFRFFFRPTATES